MTDNTRIAHPELSAEAQYKLQKLVEHLRNVSSMLAGVIAVGKIEEIATAKALMDTISESDDYLDIAHAMFYRMAEGQKA